MSSDQPLIEPVFLRDSMYSFYNFKGAKLALSVNFAIARNKVDLILHQQRIEIYSKQNNNNELFSAMTDLFIVLGNRGFAFKNRMLNKFHHLLTDDQTKFFDQMLLNQLSEKQPLGNIKHSIFNLGLDGKLLSENHFLSIIKQESHETSA